MTTTKEQLFADLKKDGISNDDDQITKAKNGDGGAMWGIGIEYQVKKRKYDKTMAWYRLAADKNNSEAQRLIGWLYYYGQGVAVDYLLAMEWYLKAAIQNNKDAWGNIGDLFEGGYGVPVDKYKALEWYYKEDKDSFDVEKLIKEGIQLKPQDKDKTIEQLVMETEDIVWPGRGYIRENMLKEKEINTLKQLMKKMEEEVQAFRAKAEDKQQEINTLHESNDQYKRNEQTINNELQALTQENHTLKLKLEEETRAKNNEINSLKEEVQTCRAIAEDKQQETNSYIESINQYKRNEQCLYNELQTLKQTNHTLTVKLEEETRARKKIGLTKLFKNSKGNSQ